MLQAVFCVNCRNRFQQLTTEQPRASVSGRVLVANSPPRHAPSVEKYATRFFRRMDWRVNEGYIRSLLRSRGVFSSTVVVVTSPLYQCRQCQPHFERTRPCARTRAPFRSIWKPRAIQPRLARNHFFRSGSRSDPCISSITHCDHDYYFELLSV